MTTYAVTGATGQLGRLAIAALKEAVGAQSVIALVRDPQKAADLGVAVREADYDRPDTLRQALTGVDKLLLISGNALGQRVAQHRAVIEAAKAAGVQYVVYTSLLRADTSPLSVAAEHPDSEAALKASGMAYTIMRNGWYHENYTDAIAQALALGAFYGSAGEGKIASASRADYAQAAVNVLTGSGHAGKTYELVGDEAYTLAQLAAEISAQSGKAIAYVDLPEAEYAQALAQAGVAQDFAALIAGWDRDAKQGALYGESRDLHQLLGRATTPIAASVKAALG